MISFQPRCMVWQIKVIPCRVLLISQQRIGIFTIQFTRLFHIHIYIHLPHYVKLSQSLTKLCHLNQGNPTFCNVQIFMPALLTAAFSVRHQKLHPS